MLILFPSSLSSLYFCLPPLCLFLLHPCFHFFFPLSLFLISHSFAALGRELPSRALLLLSWYIPFMHIYHSFTLVLFLSSFRPLNFLPLLFTTYYIYIELLQTTLSFQEHFVKVHQCTIVGWVPLNESLSPLNERLCLTRSL